MRWLLVRQRAAEAGGNEIERSDELAWKGRWNSLSPGEWGDADHWGAETCRGEGEGKWGGVRGKTWGTPRKQDSEFPVNNGRRGEIHRQKGSKNLFPICHPYSMVSPTKSSSFLLGSPLSTEPSLIALVYWAVNQFLSEWMNEIENEWKEGWMER